jgi:hypothetical protein
VIARWPPGSSSEASSDAIAAGHRVDADVDQQRCRPADHVGPDAAARQFDQMRKRVQFADHDLGRLARRRTWP